MKVHQFKITAGCPNTGHKIACNTTQYAPAFVNKQPSVADRAKEGMAISEGRKFLTALF